jgi:hypothetical protein
LITPKVLRTIFGPKRDKMVSKQHNEELQSLYFSPNIIRVTKSKEYEIYRACSTHGSEEECIKGFCGKSGKSETTRKTLT